MKKFLIALMMFMPILAEAQDNTWERIEVEQQDQVDPNAKYLAEDAVPIINGKVCFKTTIEAPGKSADEIYDILLTQLTKMTKEPNQIENSLVALQNRETHELAAVFHEWLVFKNHALSLDRTQMNYHIHVICENEKAAIELMRITYDYDVNRKPIHYVAEKWISDEYAVNKKRTKLYPISGKFRRKTIDRKDFIFNKFNTLLNEK